MASAGYGAHAARSASGSAGVSSVKARTVDHAAIALAAALIYLAGEAERAGLRPLADRIRALAAETAEQQGRLRH